MCLLYDADPRMPNDVQVSLGRTLTVGGRTQRFGPVYVQPSGDAAYGRAWERAADAEMARSAAARTSSIAQRLFVNEKC